ncbi:hypothetical protein BCON_0093g00110 [Botryotinia convoluta]|uniref:Thioester reductase (TE) domain-containing protein n=1 Tax=Botryotinia convoluta TaxID=54673 RepID=A0A4Z1I164_9HELO|nr:hypothetical protein BCON_0093g00110 [Botryotinia convoluta]
MSYAPKDVSKALGRVEQISLTFIPANNYLEDLIQTYSRNFLVEKAKTIIKSHGDGLQVILTGSTGYLGYYLLKALIADSKVARIVCLNRSEAEKDFIAEFGDLDGAQKVQFVKTSFGEPRFGLEPAIYQNFLETIDVILHNACFPPPSYFNNEIPWSHQSRWVQWPAYFCAVGIAGLWGWAIWHIEKAPFTDRRRLMFYSQSDMAGFQRQNEYSASLMLAIFPTNMNVYFATAKHVLNDQEEEKIAPVFRKLLKVAREEKYSGKEELFFCHHLIETDTGYFSHDHSMWPGRIFMTSIGLEIIAVDQVGLATIMSHQFAHTYLNHVGEEMSFELFEQRACYPIPILVLLGIASKQMRIPAVAYCLCVGLIDWYGRRWFPNIIENEADVWGLGIMKLAGFDVTKATKYWERKIKYIQAMIDKAKTSRESSNANRRQLLDHYIKDNRQNVKTNNEHMAIIQEYVEDNDILPLPVENTKTTRTRRSDRF